MKNKSTFSKMLKFTSGIKFSFWLCLSLYGAQTVMFNLYNAVINNLLARAILEKNFTILITAISLDILFTILLLALIGIAVRKYCFNFFTTEKAIKSKIFKSFVYTNNENPDKTGNSIAAINTEAELANEAISGSLAQVMGSLLGIILPLAMLLFVNLEIAMICLALGILFFFIQLFFAKPLKNNTANTLEANRKAISAVSEYLSKSLVIRMYKLQGKSIEEFDKVNKKIEMLGFVKAALNASKDVFFNLQTLISYAGIISLGSIMVSRGMITIPTLMMAPPLAQSLIMSFSSVGASFAGMQSPLKAGEKVLSMIEESDEIRARDNQREDKVWNTDSTIKIENLSFKYKFANVETLKGITLTINEGEYVSFVGESGCGKSTLLKVITGLYERDSLPVSMGNYTLGKVKSASWKNLYATVDQSSKLFDITIEENIKLGAIKGQTLNRNDIINASLLANVDSFIATLPDGYNTDCGEAGSLLSGGQRQRIAIARALVRNAPILAIDEATSALDAESERAFVDTLKKLKGEKTIISVSHNLKQTAELSDKIVVLKNGRIDSVGTHKELLERSEEYVRLYSKVS